ncbi:MAG: Rieske (2Fe-2S) protein [Anaerolineae bacterium]
MSRWIRVADTSELYPESGKLVYLDGRPVALFEASGTYYALDDTCSHSGGPLSEGFLEDGLVECPWHGARFELATGRVVRPPAAQDVRTYPTRRHDSEILVEAP